MVDSIVQVFTTVAATLSGNNTVIMALFILGIYGFIMFKLRIPASFALVIGLALLYTLSSINLIFQNLGLLLVGLVGVGFVVMMLKATRG